MYVFTGEYLLTNDERPLSHNLEGELHDPYLASETAVSELAEAYGY